MGRRGPRPTPTAILKLHGSWRAKIRKNEPKPEEGRPSCPTWLDAEGKRCWKRTVAALAAMELLTKTDRDAIAGLCQNWALFVKTSKLLNRMKRDESLMDARRLAAMNAEAYRNYARASAEFGLTCSSRSRLEVPDPAAGGRADKFDAFVGSKSG